VLGPDGRCYAWDDRANGYGRGEGIATIILKPLKQAIKDGDNIRAVVRETSVNQDGKTPTITSPSAEAQEATIRDCYRRAGLDPTQTPYVEAHMTGNSAFLRSMLHCLTHNQVRQLEIPSRQKPLATSSARVNQPPVQ
jgi:acyl transferase domain-containing protein